MSAELQNSIAMCGTFLGTFKYMSPERIRNQAYSYASDICSLGLCLSECATGAYPFEECSSCIEMAQTILDGQATRPDPNRFSESFMSLLDTFLDAFPGRRMNADSALCHPWLQMHGATS